jgi:ribosome-associated protein
MTIEATDNTIDTIETTVQLIIDALDDKRAEDLVVMDLSEVSDTLDYFVVATGASNLQLKAMEDGVKEKLKEQGLMPKGVEGPSTRWILLDYGSVVVHLMSPEARDFYDLEGLWADARRLAVSPS